MRDFQGIQYNPDIPDQIYRYLVLLGDRQNIDEQMALTSVASGDETYVFDVSETGSVKTKKVTLANLLFGLTRHKLSTFTRDRATATGTQAVTGVGFTPRAVVFVMGVNGASASAMSVGIDDAVTAVCIYNDHSVTADTFSLDATDSIRAQNAAGTDYQGRLQSMDSDGFTVSWVRNGAPTGTITIGYLALR